MMMMMIMRSSCKHNYNVHGNNTIMRWVPKFKQIFSVCFINRYFASATVGCGAGEHDHNETLRQINALLES